MVNHDKQMILDKLHLWKSKKAKLTILDHVSGIIKPGRYGFDRCMVRYLKTLAL